MKRVLLLIPLVVALLAGCKKTEHEPLSLDVATGSSTVTDFELWKTGDRNNAYTYQFAGGEWTALPDRIYAGDVNADEEYYACHTPGTIPSDGTLPDILLAGPFKIGNTLSMNFTHAFAQLRVAFVDGSGIGLPLEGATVSMTLKNEYTLDDKNVLTPGTQTYDYLFRSGTAYVVLPQTLSGLNVTVTLPGGDTYSSVISSLTLTADKATSLIFTLQATTMGISVGTSEWGTVATEGVPVTADGVMQGIDLSKLPGPGRLVLSTGNLSATYNWDGSALSSDSPLYWEQLEKGEHTFALEYTPESEGNPEKDVLSGSATAAWGSRIAFATLAHVNTRLAVKLIAGEGYTAADLVAGRLQLEGLGQSLALTQETYHILNPVASVPDAAKITLTLNGYPYTFGVNATFEALEAGKQYLLSVTVNKSGLGLSVGNVSDWTFTEGGDEVVVNDVTTGIDLSKLPGPGTLVLSTGDLSATYNWNGSALSSDSPLYWEQLSKGNHPFTLRYTPESAGNPEKDVLSGSATAAWGSRIAFATLAHVNARLAVKLIAGEGYTTAELTEGRLQLEGLGQSLALTQETYHILNPVASVPDAAKITLTLNGYPYTFGVNATFEALEAGKQYLLSVTVNKSGLGLSVGNVSDWTLTEGGDEVVVNDVTAGIDLSKLPGPGTLVLSTGDLSATYNWNGSALSSDSPLYWEQLSKGNHPFTLRYTPESAGNPEKDILSGSATAAWGSRIAFATLAHVNARLAVKLIAGEGYTAADLTEGQLQLEGLGQSLALTQETYHILNPVTSVPDAAKITLTLNGYPYTFELNATFEELEAGKQYLLSVTVNKSGLGLSVGNVSDWTLTEGGDEVVVNDVTTGIDLSKLPGPGTLVLSTGDLSATYNWNGSALSSDSPLYWEQLSKGNHTFTLRYTPESAGNPEKDVLSADATAAWGSRIAFGTLDHANTRLAVKLIAGEGYTAAELTEGRLQLEGLGQSLALTQETYHILTPVASVPDAAKITLTLNGYPYTFGLNATFEALEAGKQYLLSVTVNKSGLGLSVGNVSDWTLTEGGDEVVVNDVTTGIDLSKLPGPGTLVLSTGDLSATYNWNGSALSSDSPLYWEQLSKGNHTFTLRYTPESAGNPEKDVLSGSATADWGSRIAFATLAHVNARLAVKLIAGEGYTTAELTEGRLQLEGLGQSLALTQETYHILTPVASVPDAAKITLTLGAFTYTIKLNTIFSALESGKEYLLEATVNKSGLGLSVGNIADWTPVSGSGKFEY